MFVKNGLHRKKADVSTDETDVLLTSDHFLQASVEVLDGIKKTIKNPSKKTSEPSKNRY